MQPSARPATISLLMRQTSRVSGRSRAGVAVALAMVAFSALAAPSGATQEDDCPAGNRLLGHSYLIDGETAVDDLGGNVESGDTVRVDFSINAKCSDVELSLVSYRAPTATFSRSNAHLQEVHDPETGLFDAGSHSMDVVVPDCFFQVDFVFGAVIQQLGPADSDNFYSDQGRLIDGDNGGSGGCVPPPPPPPTPPACPTEVTASGLDFGAILVSWTLPEDATGAKVYRDGMPVATLDADTMSHADTGLTPGQSYSYVVNSLDGDTESQGCPAVAAVAPGALAPLPLECPYDVVAVAQPDGSILVAFTPPAPIDGLRVFRAASPLQLVATLPADATSYLDTDTTVGHGYTYMVVAFRGEEQSPDCSAVEATAIPDFPSPPALGAAGLAVVATAWAVSRRRAS